MVFLRPTILRTKNDNLNLTRSKYDFIRSKQLLLDKEGVSLLSNESQPVLPIPAEFLVLPAPFDSVALSSVLPTPEIFSSPGFVSAPASAENAEDDF